MVGWALAHLNPPREGYKFLTGDSRVSNQDTKQLSLFDETGNSDRYFKRKRSWSASKHRIILKYLQSFCYNLGGNKPYQSKVLNYVDGFAGEGKYDEGIGIRDFIDNSEFWRRRKNDFSDTDGSPLIALKCAKIFKEEDRVDLRCFFSEADKETNQRLQENCKSIDRDLAYKIYLPKSFSESLVQIIQDLQRYPSLFFLDCFAVKGLEFSEIVQICNYLNECRGELFLLFHNPTVARHAGQSTAKSENKSAIKAANTYAQNLTRLLGENSEQEWKNKWLELKNFPQEFEKWALKYFKSQLFYQTNIEGIASFEVKESYDDRRPQYSIVVCSNHPQKAFGELLNEFVADENKRLFYGKEKNDSIEKFLEGEWTKQITLRQKHIKAIAIDILSEDLREWLSVKDAITNLILKFGELGFLKRKEYREIMIELCNENKLKARKLGSRNKITLSSEIKMP
jgi:three-Cys-motif partner protein